MLILGLEPTHFISEGYWQHAFNYLGCRKKYSDIGTRTNTVYFRRLLATRVQLPGLQKEICRYWDSKQNRLFPKATSNIRSTTWPRERDMPILGLEPTQFISEGYWLHALNYLGCRKKYADIGNRTNTVYFRRLLATRVQLPGLQKEICRYWASNQHSLFPKATGNTRSTTWTAERNMPILGIEQTQFICEGYWHHAFNSLGCRKKYADIGSRTNTVYFRRLLATHVQRPGLQKEICRYWDSNQLSLFPKATGNTRSTTWAAGRNLPILGREPTQFISEGYC